jgi:hypothetical protein
MAEKKKAAPKYLVVRSMNARRNRAGFEFGAEPGYIDTKAAGVTDEELEAIVGDPGLMVIESGSKPDGDTPELHRAYSTDNGLPVQPHVQTERATPEQIEAAEKGEEIPPHPAQAPASPTSAATTPTPPQPPTSDGGGKGGEKKTTK